MKEKIIHFLLVLIFIFGAFLRFYNLDWDENNMYHPDERNIANAVAKIKFFEHLNPEFFAYNSFPIYLTKSIAYALAFKDSNHSLTSALHSFFIQKTTSFLEEDSSWVRDWAKIILITRYISALVSTLSIFLIFLVGKKMMRDAGGILSAFLFAFSPTFIQQAHFGVTESLLIFFLLLISFLALKVFETKKSIYWVYLGITSGLALACKVSSLSFLIIPFFTWLILVWQEKKFLKYILIGASFLFLTIFIFFVFSPYTILDFSSFKESMKYEYGIVSGKLKVPYNWQFVGTLPYFFFFKNLHWQTNLFLPILGFFGIFLWILVIVLRREKIFALPFLAFAVFYFVYVGSWYTKFIRYMLCFIPFLILGGVWLVLKLLRHQKTKVFAVACLILTLTSSFLWSLAFFSIYTRPHTRISATRWIYENIPVGKTLLHEHWDDRLPGTIPGYSQSQYNYLEMKNYDADTPEKIEEMSQNLSEGDYLIISSRRLIGSIGKNLQEWPITSHYYKKLFDGRLGYKLVATFSSYPKIFGIEIPDDLAEETFQVYDHPKIFIFKNEKKMLKEEIREELFNIK